MTTTTKAVLKSLAANGTAVNSNASASSAAVSQQALATPVLGEATQVVSTAPTGGTANSSMILKSLASGEVGSPAVWVINDSAVAIKVYCAVGETLNGGANGALTIGAGVSGVFIPVFNSDAAGVSDWRAVVIP